MSENKRFRAKCNSCNKKLYHVTKTGLCYKCYCNKRDEETVEKWLSTGKTETKHVGKIPNAIRRYILKDQNDRCIVCTMENKWNEKELVFILDHIDGRANNDNRDNLRFICPNCDSQLDTYKSKNKNSARKHRK